MWWVHWGSFGKKAVASLRVLDIWDGAAERSSLGRGRAPKIEGREPVKKADLEFGDCEMRL